MSFISKLRRRRITKGASISGTKAGTDSASVAKSVLTFLSLGLTDGAQSIIDRYTPSTKVEEFVLVSNEILNSLKRGYDEKFVDELVVMTMKVNNQSKRIELSQYGRDVMMDLDGVTIRISNITLKELYANMRNDMSAHPEIYGVERQRTAFSYPDPYQR